MIALRCEGCGCTDGDACDDPVTGTTCAWIVWSEDGLRALCSVCARILCSVSAETRSDFQVQVFRERILAALVAAGEDAVARPLIELAREFDTPETVAARCRAARAWAERFEGLPHA